MAKKDNAEKVYTSGHALLKARRIELGLSLRAAAELVGFSHSHIQHMEEGTREPSITKALTLLQAYGIPLEVYLRAVGFHGPEAEGSMVAAQGFEPRTLRI